MKDTAVTTEVGDLERRLDRLELNRAMQKVVRERIALSSKPSESVWKLKKCEGSIFDSEYSPSGMEPIELQEDYVRLFLRFGFKPDIAKDEPEANANLEHGASTMVEALKIKMEWEFIEFRYDSPIVKRPESAWPVFGKEYSVHVLVDVLPKLVEPLKY